MHSTPIVTSKELLSLKTMGEVRPYDIICGRHKESHNNIGNRRFRVTIRLSLNRYHVARTKPEKTRYFQSIIGIIQNSGGRFLKWDGQQFIEISNKEKIAKVGHAVRNIAKRRASAYSFKTNPGHPELRRHQSDSVVTMPATTPDSQGSMSYLANRQDHITSGMFAAEQFPW